MRSKPATEHRWSLTGRLAWIFGASTAGLILVFGLWSTYVVFDLQRDELAAFVEHELREFALTLDNSAGTLEAARSCTADILEVATSPPCAFRVRDADGRVLVADGVEALLSEPEPTPVDLGERPGRNPMRWTALTASIDVPAHDWTAEIVVGGEKSLEALRHYALRTSLAFLGSLLVTAATARLVARRGLRWLHDVTVQTRDIDVATGSAEIRLESPPDEVREVVTAVNAMLERIDARLAEMRTFTAGLAHELRSPLQNLIGETEVALLSERTPEEYRRLLGSNLEELEGLAGAVANLVTYCQAPDQAPHEVPAQAFDLLEEAELHLAGEVRQARRLGIEVRFERIGDTQMVADRESVLRVVHNLVSNAVTWSPDGAVVRVRAEGRADQVRLVVEDDGDGIAPEWAERVFEPFTSGQPRPGRRGGYGLGLTICRTIVAGMGGSLRHEPREAGGTRFVAEMPRRPRGTAAPPVNGATPVGRSGRAT